MSLSDLASIGSLVSGLAVLVSLVYLGQQTRQNTKHTRALIFQGGAQLGLDQFRGLADSDLAAATIVGNGGTPTPEEIRRHQFRQVCILFVVVWENFFVQHAEGLVNKEHYHRIRWAFVQSLRDNPGIREFFRQMISNAPDHRFHAFIHELIIESEPLPAQPNQSA